MTEVPKSIEAVEAMLAGQGYVAARALAVVVFLALKLGKPLFLEGEAGVGKTEIAKAIATGLGRRLIRLQCYEGLDAASAVAEWNFAAQMIAIRSGEASGRDTLFTEDFLIERPLLAAMRPQAGGAPVLLIDELDRTDEPFEAFLLEALSDFQVRDVLDVLDRTGLVVRRKGECAADTRREGAERESCSARGGSACEEFATRVRHGLVVVLGHGVYGSAQGAQLFTGAVPVSGCVGVVGGVGVPPTKPLPPPPLPPQAERAQARRSADARRAPERALICMNGSSCFVVASRALGLGNRGQGSVDSGWPDLKMLLSSSLVSARFQIAKSLNSMAPRGEEVWRL